VMLLRPVAAPPLYDGIAFPDEPYRWVQPPSGSPKTPAVTVAKAEVRVAVDGKVPLIQGLSGEQGPQLAFRISEGNLVVPKGVKTISASATPGPNPAVTPPDGTLVSNLYTLTITGDVPGELTLATGQNVVVNMRADKPTNDLVVLETFTDGTWSQVATGRVGNDVYAAELGSFGRFALVRLKPGLKPTVTPTGSVPTGGGGFNTPTADQLGQGASVGGPTLYLAGGGMVLLLLIGLFIARKRMSG